jgi:hypothetical protein
VGARLHYLQGKAEHVTDLLPLLQEFHRDKLQEMVRHLAGARLVRQYDANNTYQYIINREETQLSWLATAITELGGAVADAPTEPSRSATKGAAATLAVIDEDAHGAQALRVILGETLEQKRFFEQARAGRTDLLGRRTADVGALVGEVLPTRWIE